jgi:hypothetical protein
MSHRHVGHSVDFLPISFCNPTYTKATKKQKK